jgi:ABC-type glutathione transport system ATPase component
LTYILDVSSSANTDPFLQVKNLRITYSVNGRESTAIDDVSFTIQSGEIVGVLGQSGSGKTTLGVALLGILPHEAVITSGSICIAGKEMVGADEKHWHPIRGKLISSIWQEPRIALNPVMKVGVQVAEVARAHHQWYSSRCKEAAKAALSDVQLGDAHLYNAYPHELSGGQCQRVAIAQAIVCQPRLIIADEPTSALDTTVQLEILDLLAGLRQRLQTALLLITHNPAIVSKLADRVLVMNAGKIVEQGSARQVLSHPSHPYTQTLLEARQKLLHSTSPS